MEVFVNTLLINGDDYHTSFVILLHCDLGTLIWRSPKDKQKSSSPHFHNFDFEMEKF